MSEQQKEHDAKQPGTAKLDSTPAAAALAQALASAAKPGDKPAAPQPTKSEAAKPEPAKIPAALQTDRPSQAGRGRQAAQAAAAAVAIGLGWMAGSHLLSGDEAAMQAVPQWAVAATSNIRQNQDDLVRLTGDVRVLKSIIESMKESFDQARAEAAGQQRSLMERIDGMERTALETTVRIRHVADASDRIERASTDANAKVAALAGRLDGIERQASAAAAKHPADAPAQTGSVPEPRTAEPKSVEPKSVEPKTAAKDIPVEGWVLHDVQGGVALVESRSGRLHEVVAGQNLPSLGRVEAIERRGRTWVVVTSKGIIGVGGRWQ